MFVSYPCIILNTLPYSDSKYIINCYTAEKGKVAFMHYKSKGKRKKSDPYFYPFALIDIQFRDNEKKSIHTINNCHHAAVHHSILSNPLKRSIALFISELTHSMLLESDSNPPLYHYIKEFIQQLEQCTDGLTLYHIKYMLEFVRFTGFFPDYDFEQHQSFSQLSFETGELHAGNTINSFRADQTQWIYAITHTPYTGLSELTLNNKEISDLLDSILKMYALHFPGFKTPDSLRIFREF